MSGWLPGTDPTSPRIRRFSELVSACLESWRERGVQPMLDEARACIEAVHETIRVEFEDVEA